VGPNGAGKTTVALRLLPSLGITEFVNADLIARGLSPLSPESTDVAAGRLMLGRIRELAGRRENFGFETTLASRSFAPFLARESGRGYEIRIHYLWVESVEISLSRVAERVRRGGHGIAEDVIRRRYLRGLRNFFTLYMSVADHWVLSDNTGASLTLIAQGKKDRGPTIHEPRSFQEIQEALRAGEGPEA
jgi:predicted ABC-type ATPase